MWVCCFFFFFKQKTAYEIGTGDWSSDVCSSDLDTGRRVGLRGAGLRRRLLGYGLLAAGAVAVSLLDRPVYRLLHWPQAEVNDWYQALRQEIGRAVV